jgi:membrane associated rhomboid family serine protease
MLIALTLVIYLWEATLSQKELMQVAYNYAIIPIELNLRIPNSFSEIAAWYPLITSVFLHSGWMHVLGNMLYLWVFGDNVEDRLGHGRYLLFYLTAGIIGGMAQVLAEPALTIPVLGASGAVAGVLGAYVISYPRARVEALLPPFFIVRIRALVFILFWFGLQLLNGVASLAGNLNQVAWWAHIGGFLGGIGLLFLLKTDTYVSLEEEC